MDVTSLFSNCIVDFAGSDELQEGLAVLSEYLVGGLSPPRFRLLAGRVIAAQMLIKGSSFRYIQRIALHLWIFPANCLYHNLQGFTGAGDLPKMRST